MENYMEAMGAVIMMALVAVLVIRRPKR